MGGFVINPGWLGDVYALTDALFEGKLGPEIRDDAKEMCPVFGVSNSTAKPESIAAAIAAGNDTPGGLRDSIEDHLDGHTLIVAATGGGRWYAYWVETGHNVVAWGKNMHYSKPPQPFLRPALMQARL